MKAAAEILAGVLFVLFIVWLEHELGDREPPDKD